MALIKQDGTYSSASATGKPRISFPIEGDTTAQIVEQDFQIFFASFTPTALDTPHATITNAYLVSESSLNDRGGGVAQWTKIYAKVPATRSEYETFTYKFPGYLGPGTPPYNQYLVTDPTIEQRDPLNLTVVSRVEYKYFLCASGQTYTTPTAAYDAESEVGQVYSVDTNDEARVEYLFDLFMGVPSEPSLTAYKALVAAGTEIVAEDSQMSRWRGNIYEIKTRYVVAK